ncbi:hypothetical protein AZOA_45210 [Azoarcus sp. Aa7]|nr:hypothetical protein [Azoarcus sp. Aa7]
MMLRSKITLLAALVAAYAGGAVAAVTAEEAKQLGTTLLPWGAEKAGNKDGTIPEWTGPVKAANYDPKVPGARPDPFANEKPVLVIDGKNVDKYADKLPEGIKAMLKKYPSYRLDIYPTHRTANYPKHFQDNAIKNATACKTMDNELKLDGCYAGTPFPIPKTGNEVMWNRLLKYDNHITDIKGLASYLVDPQGNKTVAGVYDFTAYYPIFDPKKTNVIGPKDPYEKIRIDYWNPARKAGEKLVIHDNVDMVSIGRQAWSYLPGQRRVKLSPDVAYDTPSPTGGTASTVDDSAVFYGALDRYDFKLVGKKEMYIPYNAYKARDLAVCPPDTVNLKLHLNPDCMRWELHRVWVVEANVKPGLRHMYPKRVFYWDEDLPGVGISDNYDVAGQLYRTTHSIPITFYEAQGQGHATDQFVTYDLTNGYYGHQMYATDPKGWEVVQPKPEHFFSPEALAGSGVR